jgi:peptide/nickel transport system permease protein
LFYLVVFGIVGSTTKVVRSIVLQIKEEQFIEAAQSYGASRGRILFKYIIPRIMPYTFALVALSVPAFIFVEASLSFLGLGDPVLPTWGAIIGEAYTQGALFYGWWWWIIFPSAGIIYTTIGFALLGYAFDKVLNPRLREE